jgi:ABC-type transport system substrate-binding protein
MSSLKIVKIGIPALIFLLFSGTGFIISQPSEQLTIPWDYPRLDTLCMVLAYPRTYAMEIARACEMDNFVGAFIADDYIELTSDPYCWSISQEPGFNIGYVGVNCREVTLTSSGTFRNYHGRTSGFPLYPLNMSQFRMALEIIVSGSKTAWIAEFYQSVCVRIDQVVPPASEYWFNPCITEYESNWNIAESILTGAGFVWDIGPDLTEHTVDDSWLMPNGQWLWNPAMTWGGKYHSERYAGYCSAPGDDAYGIWVMPPDPSLNPCGAYWLAANHASQWNSFFCGTLAWLPCTDLAPLLFLDDAAFAYDVLTQVAFYNRDHDIYFDEWFLNRNPDYLYDFFSPDVDVPGGDNSPGLSQPGLNRLLAAIKFWTFNDFEVLASNVDSSCDPTVVIPIGTSYDSIGPFTAPHAVTLAVERANLWAGVYDEALVEDVNYSVSWFTIPFLSGYYCSITLLQPITLNSGEALEALFPVRTYSRLITTAEEMRNLVYLAQWKLYYLAPYLPVYSRNYINLYKPGVTCWVNSKGFGSETFYYHWTLGSLHWTGTPIGGNLNWNNPGPISTLNPIEARTAYELYVLGTVIEGLTTIDPYTHADVPWIACKWELIPWVDIGIGVENGMIIRLWLRNDVYWQDGNHVTAADVAWNFEFIESLTPPELQPIWSTLEYYVVGSDYQIDLYVNVAGPWKFLEFARAALTFPKVIWDSYMGDYDPDTTTDYTSAKGFTPETTMYNAHVGSPPPNGLTGLTCLIGTGPYIFESWNKLVGLGRVNLTKHYTYWMKETAFPNAQLPQLVAPTITYKTLISGEKVPTCTKSYIEVTVQNVNTKEPCAFDWILYKDVTPIASGSVANVDPCDYTTFKVSASGLGPCLHNYTLEVTNADGTTTYTLTAAWLVGDGNWDGVTDMADIDNLITLFLYESSQPGFLSGFDFNSDDIIDMADISIAVDHFVQQCNLVDP